MILASAFGVAGILIATRVPSNPIGWILLAAGIGTAFQELATHYAQYGLYVEPGSLPGADVAAWINEWIWIPYMASVALLIPMLYPTGTLPSPRWRIPLAVGLTAALFGGLLFAIAPGDLGGYPGIPNPAGFEGATWIRAAGNLVMFVFLGGVLCAIASMAMRYRRSHGDERQQLKWLLLSLALDCWRVHHRYPVLDPRGGGTSGEEAPRSI